MQACNIVIVFIYCPGVQQVNSTFFEELSDLVQFVASKVVPVFIIGEMNIHLDDLSLVTTTNFTNIVSGCDMEQLEKEPKHRAGYTLDVVIVHSSTAAIVSVDPPVISDNSLITAVANVGSAAQPQATNVSRRNWFTMDIEEFCHDLLSSELCASPPGDIDTIFECYDNCPRRPCQQARTVRDTECSISSINTVVQL